MVEQGGPQLAPSESGGGEGGSGGQPPVEEKVDGEKGVCVCMWCCVLCVG